MNYYITKIKLNVLDSLQNWAGKVFSWANDHSYIIRLGIHKNEDTEEIKITNMKKKWNDLLKRMKTNRLNETPVGLVLTTDANLAAMIQKHQNK